LHVSVEHCLDLCLVSWTQRERERERERDRGHSTFLLNIALIVFGFFDPERQGSFHVSVEHCLECGFFDPYREIDTGVLIRFC
jgi:hypothetical protein